MCIVDRPLEVGQAHVQDLLKQSGFACVAAGLELDVPRRLGSYLVERPCAAPFGTGIDIAPPSPKIGPR